MQACAGVCLFNQLIKIFCSAVVDEITKAELIVVSWGVVAYEITKTELMINCGALVNEITKTELIMVNCRVLGGWTYQNQNPNECFRTSSPIWT